MYNEVLVVEGKNDKARILAIFPNLEVVTTNGSEISNETLDMLEELSKNNKIIFQIINAFRRYQTFCTNSKQSGYVFSGFS